MGAEYYDVFGRPAYTPITKPKTPITESWGQYSSGELADEIGSVSGTDILPGISKNKPIVPSKVPMGKWQTALGNVGQGVSAFATLGELYLGFKAMKQGKKEFNFQKSAYNQQYADSLKAYDNQLRDNYLKYKHGSEFFGFDYLAEDQYMKERSLSAPAQPTPLSPPAQTAWGINNPPATAPVSAPVSAPAAAPTNQTPVQYDPRKLFYT